MKKTIQKSVSALLVLAMVLSCTAASFAVQTPTDIPAGNSNFIKPVTSLTEAPEGYTPIRTASELDSIRNNLTANYILMNDIDLADFGNWVPIGNVSNSFKGIFNGNGYVIKNLKIDFVSTDSIAAHIGLFGCGQYAGTIINLGIENANVNATASNLSAGIIAGEANSIANCYVTGSINVTASDCARIGGICGELGSIHYCRNDAAVTAVCKDATILCGGIAGNVIYVSGCINNSSIRADADMLSYVGGISGFGSKSLNCANTGCITSYALATGGISGFSTKVTCCYSTGSITDMSDSTDSLVGAVVGYSTFVEPIDRLNPLVIGDSVVHIIRCGTALDSGLINFENCYYTNSDLPICGNAPLPLGAVKSSKALNADEMKQQASFKGFDFENVWTMSQNGTPTISNKLAVLKTSMTIKYTETAKITACGSVGLADSTSSNHEVAYSTVAGIFGKSEGTATIDYISGDGRFGQCTVTVELESGLGYFRELLAHFLESILDKIWRIN